MYCVICGYNAGGYKYCPMCGAMIVQSVQEHEINSTEEFKNTTLLLNSMPSKKYKHKIVTLSVVFAFLLLGMVLIIGHILNRKHEALKVNIEDTQSMDTEEVLEFVDDNISDTTMESIEEITEIEIITSEEAQSEENFVNSTSDDRWKQAYSGFLYEIMPELYSFAGIYLEDMDGDGIPEMLVDTKYNTEYSGIYSYNNGSVNLLLSESMDYFVKLNGMYFCSTQHEDPGIPIKLYMLHKENDNIIKDVECCIFKDSYVTEASVCVEGNQTWNELNDCLTVMQGYGVVYEYIDYGDYGFWDFTIPGSVEIPYCYEDLEDGVAAQKFEEFIWSYN